MKEIKLGVIAVLASVMLSGCVTSNPKIMDKNYATFDSAALLYYNDSERENIANVRTIDGVSVLNMGDGRSSAILVKPGFHTMTYIFHKWNKVPKKDRRGEYVVYKAAGHLEAGKCYAPAVTARLDLKKASKTITYVDGNGKYIGERTYLDRNYRNYKDVTGVNEFSEMACNNVKKYLKVKKDY
jgi:hypothetical protein